MTSVPPKGPVWAKRVADAAVLAMNVAYCAGRDVAPRPAADEALTLHDLDTNAAHAIMLGEAGILSAGESASILGALVALRARAVAGERLLDADCEDIHMSVEQKVTAIAGDGAGGRLHTARSRNDQVATDMRLWLRTEVIDLAAGIAALARSLAAHALAHAECPCPGLTHMQPGMVTTWGHWVASYLPRLARDLRALAAVQAELRECPLGSAASFGSSWPTDRARTAALLGFAGPTPSTVDPIHARGELEARYAFAVAQHLAHLSGIGQDLILLSSPPRTWVRLPDAFVTGSSIMPQKRNPDFAEVTRAKAAVVAGQVQAFLGIAHAAPAGYNRDTQWTKYLAMDVAAEVAGAPRVFGAVFDGLAVDADAMRDACAQGFLNATDVADWIARTRGVPFRVCYRLLGEAVRNCEATGRLTREAINAALASSEGALAPFTAEEWAPLDDPGALLSLRRQPGSPNPDAVRASVASLSAEVAELEAGFAAEASRLADSRSALWALAEKVAHGAR